MAKGFKLDSTGSRCRSVKNGKYAKFMLCQVSGAKRDG